MILGADSLGDIKLDMMWLSLQPNIKHTYTELLELPVSDVVLLAHIARMQNTVQNEQPK